MEQLKTSQLIAIMYLGALLFIQQARGLQCGAQNAFCALIRRSFAAPNLFETAWQDGSAKNPGSSSKRGFHEDGSAKNLGSSSKRGFHEDGLQKSTLHTVFLTVLYGFGQVMDLNGDGPIQIRDRTGQTQDAMMSARRKLHPERRLFQEHTAAPVQFTIPIQFV